MTRKLDCPDEAGEIIREGGIVAFPTETVFGLGVDATNERAIQKLYAAKGRPGDNPLIVHVDNPENWRQAAAELTSIAKTLLDAFSPGPITVVLPKGESISSLVTAGLDTVGLRIPDHADALQLLKAAQVPVAAPSANLSGRPSATTWQAVVEDLDQRIDAVLCRDVPSIGIESTVVDCCGDSPVILRPGAISIEQIRDHFPNAIDFESRQKQEPGDDLPAVNSPGVLHPHYQPAAKVELIDFSKVIGDFIMADNAAYCGLTDWDGMDKLAFRRLFETCESYASGFYEFLRQADRKNISVIYVEQAPGQGIGKALLDRQQRAAGLK